MLTCVCPTGLYLNVFPLIILWYHWKNFKCFFQEFSHLTIRHFARLGKGVCAWSFIRELEETFFFLLFHWLQLFFGNGFLVSSSVCFFSTFELLIFFNCWSKRESFSLKLFLCYALFSLVLMSFLLRSLISSLMRGQFLRDFVEEFNSAKRIGFCC